MKSLREQLIDKIALVLREPQSKEELSEWSLAKLLDILDNKSALLIDHLALYPFLSALSVKDPWEKCSDTIIQEYYDVLVGNKDTRYSCFIKNIHEPNVEINSVIESILGDYINHKGLTETNLIALEKISATSKIIESVDDILYGNLFSLLSSLPIKANYEVGVSTIYVNAEDVSVESILTRINTMLRYLNGAESFYFSVHYNEGNYKILLM